jgi:hypothetical protein
MMTDKLRAAAQAAYRAMISAELSDGSRREWEAAVDVLKDALAEPAIKESLTTAEQEPVAWKDKTYGNLHHVDYGGSVPLYAAPPSREWVGLMDEEIYVEAEKEEQAHGFILGAMWAETKLKEKNT